MKTWEAQYIGRYGSRETVHVAAANFLKAIDRVRVAARRKYGDRKPVITSIVQTAKLDA